MDLWIIASATARQKLDYSILLSSHLLPAGDEHFQGLLSFGSIITHMLINLGIDLSELQSVSSTMYVSALNVLMVLDLPTDVSPPPQPSASILGPRPEPTYVKKTQYAGETSNAGGLVFTVSDGNSSSNNFAASAP
ncbi:unnamed protein product [Linum trigynum]|uniref:Uncharacterized protein n=1 Tax=Linum trigynum TaxID=586398 RepID=A0AAV2FL83_9ROSI